MFDGVKFSHLRDEQTESVRMASKHVEMIQCEGEAGSQKCSPRCCQHCQNLPAVLERRPWAVCGPFVDAEWRGGYSGHCLLWILYFGVSNSVFMYSVEKEVETKNKNVIYYRM